MRLTMIVTAAALLAAGPARAQDGPDPKRRVAILEYRDGSPAIPAVDKRAAELLGKLTSLRVIDIDDARKAYGNHIDRDVVRCAGEARCIARIGAKLDVDEVVLVGVSEFGDVILTLQRIDVRRGKVRARIAEALAPDATPSTEQLTDYLRRVMPKRDFIRFGVIRIAANVAGAEVVVGDEVRGKTPVDPIKVPAPQTYEIRLTKPGYVPFRATVAVPPDADVKVRPVLSKEGAGGGRRWWIAGVAGAVVVGVVTTAVVVTRGDPSELDVVGEFPPRM